MATFEYNVEYNERKASFVLNQTVVKALDTGLTNPADISKTIDRTGFDATYVSHLQQDRVLIGIRSMPAKPEGAVQVTMQFCGDEKAIMAAKRYILNSVGGLKLE
jgi:hypothetical protein